MLNTNIHTYTNTTTQHAYLELLKNSSENDYMCTYNTGTTQHAYFTYIHMYLTNIESRFHFLFITDSYQITLWLNEINFSKNNRLDMKPFLFFKFVCYSDSKLLN